MTENKQKDKKAFDTHGGSCKLINLKHYKNYERTN
jgi:hypothetical protein